VSVMRCTAALALAMLAWACAAYPQALENTYWKLTLLGDTPVAAVSKPREAHFILYPDSRRVSGSGGCNRLMGRYELKDDRLTFGNMASTMMACADGMDTEQAFHRALELVSKVKITGQRLELYDAAGNIVAHFEATDRSTSPR